MCSTATCPTRRSTARCAACCRCWRSTPPTAGLRLPAPPRRWRMGSPCPTRTRYWSRSCGAASARSPSHLQDLFTSNGGELRLRSKVDEILVADGRVTGVRLEDGTTVTRADRRLRASHPTSRSPGWSTAPRCPPTSGSGSPASTIAAATCRCTSRSTAYRNSRAPYEVLNDPDMQSNIGIFSTPEELQQQWEDCRRGIVPADPADRAADPVGQRSRPGAARQARRVGVLAVVPDRGGRSPATAR